MTSCPCLRAPLLLLGIGAIAIVLRYAGWGSGVEDGAGRATPHEAGAPPAPGPVVPSAPASLPGPRVGQKAPAVRAEALADRRVVDLARPARATVLLLGSWT